jgi:phosphoribosyl-ATP pyrophosphohydrolase
MIELKNINLDGIDTSEQILKVYEELMEFIEALTVGNIDNAIEEYFDALQAGLGALHKLGIDAEQVMKEYPKHIEKIKKRPRVKENE